MIKDNIGNTPLRRHDALSEKYRTQVWIKEEFSNPGGSSKDRVACYMLLDAIKQNKLPEGGIFVEASSGNTGISLAMLAKEMGYQCKIFISSTCSEEKRQVLRDFGAELEVCENSNGLHDFQSTQYLAQAYAANHPNAYFTNQYYNSCNIQAHYRGTGPEIWKQSREGVTHVLIGMGTGGTISGVGRYLKEQNPEIQIWGVEPNHSVYQLAMANQPIPEDQVKFDPIEGIGRTFIPGSFDRHAVDRVFQVSAAEAIYQAEAYAETYSALLGFSSAAVLAALDRHLGEMNLKESDQLVLLFPDYGDRYLDKLYPNLQQPSKLKIIAGNASI